MGVPRSEISKHLIRATCMLMLVACSDAHSVSKPDASGPDPSKPDPSGEDGGSSKPRSDAGQSRRDAGPSDAGMTERFSFFVTSYAALQRLSGSEAGFGGDLRYGEEDGLAGADKICREIAETSMPGAGKKTWRAFLSVTAGPDGAPVHAIDRIGDGPWYDRLGRLVAMTRADLMNTRPLGADPAIVNDLPNEDGIPNQSPEGMPVDNHDMLTGSDAQGFLYKPDWSVTCHDWTSAEGKAGRPRVGHSWPRNFGDFTFGGMGGTPPPFFGDGGFGSLFGDGGFDFASFDPASWISALDEAGCAPGANLIEMGPPDPSNPTVGSGGGYGGFYCFALQP